MAKAAVWLVMHSELEKVSLFKRGCKGTWLFLRLSEETFVACIKCIGFVTIICQTYLKSNKINNVRVHIFIKKLKVKR